MSLKAKIEAVIYASEEPVTLAQLMGLLGGEAQAELDALESRQQSFLLDDGANQGPEPGDQDALDAETLGEGKSATDTAGANSEPEAESDVAAAAQEIEGVESASPEDAPHDLEPSGTEITREETAPAAVQSTEEEKPSALDPAATAAQTRLRERRLREYFRSVLDHLIADYANGDRGLEIREVAGGYRLATKPEYHDAVRGFVKSLKPPLKLSMQALETLAVIAYKQPVTAPEISEVRGVDSGGVLGSLMTRKLITTAGRKQVIGRPILYKTTKEFLVRFGLKDINELPSIEEFEKMAGELADTSPMQEEIAMEAPSANAYEEAVAAGDTPVIADINATPATADVQHESMEELMSDHSDGPEGRKHETTAAHHVEPMRGVHEAQADGVPDESGESESNVKESVREIDNHEPYTGNDERGA